jgi:hypothetical protein
VSELFELEILGGPLEVRYRKARPEVEAMPWGTLDVSAFPDDVVRAAQINWTTAAFQEHRTASACCATLRALVECRAPLDVIAGFSRFPLDEVVHVELCARMAMELGGAAEVWHEPTTMVSDARPELSPLLRACELVTRNFCVGESLSIPLLHGSWLRTTHPLPRAILGRIVKDEAAHGIFGWHFLDWALPLVDERGREMIAATATAAIGEIKKLWADVPSRPRTNQALGWMQPNEYLRVAERSLLNRVLRPFAERGFSLSSGGSASSPGSNDTKN